MILDVSAKTKDGKEIFRDEKILMPQATNSRGDAMMYGAHFKMGYTRDTSLQPLQTRIEKYEIKFPYEDKEGKREILAKEIDITVELRYQADPAIGEIGKDSFVFYKETRTAKIQ
jgi:hypothetical protein